MCGISGYYNFNETKLKFSTLKNMTDLQRHRGPDDQGFVGFSFKNKSVRNLNNYNSQSITNFEGGIGFNRLSIVDLSPNGHQPMVCNDKNVILAFNGEIYNANKYKNELIKKGYFFKGTSDTEILLYMYKEYGLEKLLKKIKGMFAFVIVDLEKNSIYIVRDHFGIKPMYLYRRKDLLLFSSEIKSFYAHPKFKNEFNQKNLSEFLLFRYCSDDRTLLKNVTAIPPASFGKIKNEDINIYKYWDSKDFFCQSSSNSKTIIYGIEKHLNESIKSQLMGDVKIGCQLSGGVDSSIVTYLAKQNYNANMDAFSIIFKEKKYNEEEWISFASKVSKTDNHKFMYSNKYTIDNIFSATWHLDTPINLPNTIGIKLLAEKSSDYVKVLLSGEGADEIFCGYEKFFNIAYRQNNISFLKILSLLPFIKNKINRRFEISHNLDKYMILSNASMILSDLYKFADVDDISAIIAKRMNGIPKSLSPLKKAVYNDINTWLVDLLMRQDKMMMAHSVENRVPYLDKDLVEYVFKNFDSVQKKFNPNLISINKSGFYTKKILKDLSLKYFNYDFTYRLKGGFPLPIYDLFYNSKMFEIISDDLLPSIKNRGIMNFQNILKLWYDTRIDKDSGSLKNLWMVISFEIWAQLFLDRKNVN